MSILTAAVTTAAIEFAGYFKISGKEPKFVLVDSTDGKSSGWIGVGQSFKEHTIVSFDAKKDTLSVRRSGGIIELP